MISEKTYKKIFKRRLKKIVGVIFWKHVKFGYKFRLPLIFCCKRLLHSKKTCKKGFYA